MNLISRLAAAAAMFVLPLAVWSNGIIVTGTDAGVTGHVKVFHSGTGAEIASFLPYASFTGGVRVAAGDVNGDGVPDIITGTGAGSSAHIKVFDGTNLALMSSFFAYDPAFTGGVYVASADVDGDGIDEIVTGTGAGGGTHIKAFKADATMIRSVVAYAGFGGAVRVGAGDFNNDGQADLFAMSGPVSFPHAKVFNSSDYSLLSSFFAYGTGFAGGAYIAAGDIDGDGFDDIITGTDAGAPPHVKVFSGPSSTEIRSFFAYGGGFTGGVRVGSADLNGDGFDDIITGTGPGAAHVKVFHGVTNAEIMSFLPYAGYNGGIYVAGSSAVPEPATLVLLSGGLLMLLRRRRR